MAPAPPLLLLEELVPELPLLPELPLEPLEPLDPELLVLEPASGFDESGFDESVVPLSTVESVVFGGSFAPGSLSGTVGCWSACRSAPSPSSGDVAHAEIRATSERTPVAMRLERRMEGTLAAELYLLPVPHAGETLR